MSWSRSLRVRLTALFLVVSGGAVVLAAVAMGVLVERTVWRTVDAQLSEEGETLCSLLAAGARESVQTAAEATVREPGPGSHKFALVRDAQGQVVAQAGMVPPQVESATNADHEPYRIVREVADGCAVVMGAIVTADRLTIGRARRWIAAAAAALLALLGGLAWLVTSRATAELDRLAAEVETIEAGSLDRRLSEHRTLEVDRLAAVLNRLLARLEANVSHLRRFTADAAHELRTPLAGLRARLEVTIGGPADATALRSGMLDALEQTERLGRLAEDLLELSAVEGGGEGVRERVRLDTLATEAAEFFEPVAAEQGRQFEVRAPTAVSVQGVPGLLKRVLLNLLGNAFRHTVPPAGVWLSVRADGSEAVIEVSDGGQGIAAEDLPRVFDRFYRGRAATAAAGAGLGLAMSREIVLRHGGTIAIDRSGAGGTRVTVRLPRSD